MESLDAAAFLADTDPAEDEGPWADVLRVLAKNLAEKHSGAQVRVARADGSAVIAESGCAAWILARFGEPAVIVLRAGLAPGEPSWHTARMLVALNGSPLSLEPEVAGVIGSRVRPREGWTDPEDEELDGLAVATLRSMGVPRRMLRRLSTQRTT